VNGSWLIVKRVIRIDEFTGILGVKLESTAGTSNRGGLLGKEL
jgi:hypothetical protein